MKKRILSLLLALVMVLSLAACASSEAPKTTEAPKTEAPKDDAPQDDAPQETLEDVTESDFYGPIYDEWSEMTD